MTQLAGRHEPPNRGGHVRASGTFDVEELGQAVGWIGVGAGLTAVVVGLGRRNPGKVGGVLAALACTAGLGATWATIGKAGRKPGSAPIGEAEVQHSITIGKNADELYQRWRDPKTLPQVMAFLATVRASGDGRMHWEAEGPLGRRLLWDTEVISDRPGEGARWRSLPGAGVRHEGGIHFRPAAGDRGSVATLHLRFDPPTGAFGAATVPLLNTTPLRLAADQALHRFKSLVETGEIPTTERQPAARADTR